MKVETHNHPSAIAPRTGAGTGAGGEIRDEGAVGRGARPKAGLSGFSVSNLHIPGYPLPWEGEEYGRPPQFVKIGRASCRESVWSTVVGGALEKQRDGGTGRSGGRGTSADATCRRGGG